VKGIVQKLYLIWYRNWFSHYPRSAQHERYLKDLCAKVEASVRADCPLV